MIRDNSLIKLINSDGIRVPNRTTGPSVMEKGTWSGPGRLHLGNLSLSARPKTSFPAPCDD